MAEKTTPEPAEQATDAAPEESTTEAIDETPEETTPEVTPDPEPEVKPEPTKPKARAKDWEFQAPPAALVTRIQRALGRRGRYSGPANGKFDERTAAGVQKTLATEGFKGKQDGDLETRNQVQRIQEYAKQYGGFAGDVDRKLTDQVWAAFALAVERKQND
jgi:outer membrane biosynthesis protein TonB